MAAFNAMVANSGRLEILTALAVEDGQEFMALRRRTGLTDGNLSSHAKRLHSAGLVQIDKAFRAGKPVTTYHLTPTGRAALEGHVRRLLSALANRRAPGAPISTDRQPSAQPAPAAVAVADEPEHERTQEDWVD